MEGRERWLTAGWEEEAPKLRRLAESAIAREPSPEALRDLATGSCALESLDRASEKRAQALVRWGLKKAEPDVRWDAVHAAGELRLEPLARDLLKVLENLKLPAHVRGRATEAYADCAEEADGRARLEQLKVDDPEWTVRRLAEDTLRHLRRGDAPGFPSFRIPRAPRLTSHSANPAR